LFKPPYGGGRPFGSGFQWHDRQSLVQANLDKIIGRPALMHLLKLA
jgi:hypothetical protein